MSMSKLIMQIIEPQVDLEGAAADVFALVVPHGIRVQDVQVVFIVATPAVLTTPGVVSVDHTPVGGARTEKGTYTAIISQAIGVTGQLLDASGNPVNFLAAQGDTIIFEHKTLQTATQAGEVKFILYGYLWPDAVVA